MRGVRYYFSRGAIVLQSRDEIVSVVVNINPVTSKWSLTSMVVEACSNVALAFVVILNIFFFFWIVRLLALRPLLAYCASLG
jgi:hypothetical protein